MDLVILGRDPSNVTLLEVDRWTLLVHGEFQRVVVKGFDGTVENLDHSV
jgi:hypothetical protein